MYFLDMDAKAAVALGKKLRPAIDPIGGFPTLLMNLDRAMAANRRR